MNFKFENDLDNNLLLLTVTTELRKKISQPRVVYRWKDIETLVQENYTCPDSHTLSECINPHQVVTNDSPVSCVRTWKFKLIPKVQKAKASTKSKQSKPKNQKTSVAKQQS